MFFIRIFILNILLLSGLFGKDSNIKRIESFVSDAINKQKIDGTLNSVKVVKSGVLSESKDWNYYKVEIKLTLNKGGESKDIIDYQTFFVSDGIMAANPIRLKTKKFLGEKYARGSVDDEHYSQETLVAGNIDAKNKIIIFSDPQCPSCRAYTPKVIKFAKDNPEALAVHYYSFPLDMHPSAYLISKAILVSVDNGVENIYEKVYETEDIGSISTTDFKKFVREFNSALDLEGEEAITIEDMKDKEVTSKVNAKMALGNKLGVSSTPTIFYNGKYENRRDIYLDAKK